MELYCTNCFVFLKTFIELRNPHLSYLEGSRKAPEKNNVCWKQQDLGKGLNLAILRSRTVASEGMAWGIIPLEELLGMTGELREKHLLKEQNTAFSVNSQVRAQLDNNIARGGGGCQLPSKHVPDQGASKVLSAPPPHPLMMGGPISRYWVSIFLGKIGGNGASIIVNKRTPPILLGGGFSSLLSHSSQICVGEFLTFCPPVHWQNSMPKDSSSIHPYVPSYQECFFWLCSTKAHKLWSSA